MSSVPFDGPRVTRPPDARAVASASIRLIDPRRAAVRVVLLSLAAALPTEASRRRGSLAANRMLRGPLGAGPVPDVPALRVHTATWKPPFAWNGVPAYRAVAPNRFRKGRGRATES